MSSSKQRRSKKMSLMGSMNSELSPDIIELIFSKLPIAQFPLCRLVCKAWNSLLLNLPSSSLNSLLSNTFFLSSSLYDFPFLANHDALYSVEYTPSLPMIKFSASFRLHSDWSNALIVGSCNGLLCITKPSDSVRNYAATSVAILNLMTNDYFQLPELSTEQPTPFYGNFSFYGFGFSLETQQYKIARITQIHTPLGILTSSLHIFTFGKSTEWTHMGSLPFTVGNHAVYSNGALFWARENYECESVMVCRMSLEDSTFDPIPVSQTNFNIGLFNAGLYTTYPLGGGGNKFQVSIMPQDSWITEFVVDNIPQLWRSGVWLTKFQLLRAYEDGNILCLVHGLYFILYNSKIGRVEKLIQTDEGFIARRIMNRTRGGRNKNTLLNLHIDALTFDSLQNIFSQNGMVDS